MNTKNRPMIFTVIAVIAVSIVSGVILAKTTTPPPQSRPAIEEHRRSASGDSCNDTNPKTSGTNADKASDDSYPAGDASDTGTHGTEDAHHHKAGDACETGIPEKNAHTDDGHHHKAGDTCGTDAPHPSTPATKGETR
jgi:hypothetical protein